MIRKAKKNYGLLGYAIYFKFSNAEVVDEEEHKGVNDGDQGACPKRNS